MMILWRILSLIIGYGFGLIQTGYFIGKLKHVDIRKHGSGSSGTTNALRTMGTGAGVITFIGDLLKGILAVLLCRMLFASGEPGVQMVIGLYAGLGVVLGHMFPFYLDFKGGKGVASSLGIMALLDWRLIIIPVVVFLIIVLFTRYISLGSVTNYIVVGMEAVLFGAMGVLHVDDSFIPEVCILIWIIVLLGVFRHKDNIVRLLKGTENQVHFGKKNS